ncbi:hypothetical protein [Viridibacillus arvi]|uniref:hypothetical protein n=1 Tax=Viridibacillus arvi TaxID=263475 RepID=UPI0034CE18F0
MKNMPYALKQKLRQYDKAQKKAYSIHDEIVSEFDKYGVPYENLTALSDAYEDGAYTEALAFINNNEGRIEDNIHEIEKIFLHFVNNK